jgi:hypothetical protein
LSSFSSRITQRIVLSTGSQPDRAALFARRGKNRVKRVIKLLEMLVLLGQAVFHEEGRYAAA